MCAQEVDKDVYEALVVDKPDFECSWTARPKRTEGLMIMWRKAIMKSISSNPLILPYDNESRLAIFHIFELHCGGYILVVNTHLLGNPALKQEQLEQVRTALSAIARAAVFQGVTLPVLFCGDFNARPGSDTYTEIQSFNANNVRFQ